MANKTNLIIYSDGAARGNPGPAGAGGVIKNESGDILFKISDYVGEQTNNAAEYIALIICLEKAISKRSRRIKIFADSELMVRQINGIFKIKNAGLQPLYNRVKQLLERYQAEIVYIPREKNREADSLANEAIDAFLAGEKREIKVENLDEQRKLF